MNFTDLINKINELEKENISLKDKIDKMEKEKEKFLDDYCIALDKIAILKYNSNNIMD